MVFDLPKACSIGQLSFSCFGEINETLIRDVGIFVDTRR